MTRTLRLFVALLIGISASASAQAPSAARPAGPVELFRTALPDMPGKQFVVVALTIAPRAAGQPPSPGHRHPGSVYVYVTEGTARFAAKGDRLIFHAWPASRGGKRGREGKGDGFIFRA